jgi:hypothetical protein
VKAQCEAFRPHGDDVTTRLSRACDRRPSNLRRHELGLYLPSSFEGEEVAPALPQVGTYLTYSELTHREPIPETEIIGQLERMSAADCLLALAHIGTRMFAGANRGLPAAFSTTWSITLSETARSGKSSTRSSETRGGQRSSACSSSYTSPA